MIDSERLYTVATNAVLAPYGKEMTWDIKAKLMGRPAHDAAARLIEATGIPLSVDELLTTMDAQLDGLFRSVEPLPGVVKLVKHLEQKKVPMAVRLAPSSLCAPSLCRQAGSAQAQTALPSSRRSQRARSARTSTSRVHTCHTSLGHSRARSCAVTTPSSRARASRTRPSSSRRRRCWASSASHSPCMSGPLGTEDPGTARQKSAHRSSSSKTGCRECRLRVQLAWRVRPLLSLARAHH